MIFTETPLQGAYLVDLEPRHDERGFFARTYCRREFEARGLISQIAQCNISSNVKAGTIRGMHFQKPPSTEAKLVRCVQGAIYDVIIDLRTKSQSYKKHFAVELSADNRRALFVPEFFAHGFQTLQDSTEVEYQMSEFYSPGAAAGFRYDDSRLGIAWPLAATVISSQDRTWPLIA